MSRVLKKLKMKKNIFIGSMLCVIAVFVVLFGKGTYSNDVINNSYKLFLDCPNSFKSDGIIECSLKADLSDIIIYGLSAKYNISDDIVVDEFVSSDWEIYSTNDNGFVIVNLDGITGNVEIGTIKFNIAMDDNHLDKYIIELMDINLGDGDNLVLNIEKVFDEIVFEENEIEDIDINFSNILVDENNNYLKYNIEETTVKSLLDNINIVGNGRVFVSDKDGNEKTNDDIIVTGDIFSVFVGSEKQIEYKIAIRGDANGDGKVTLTDLVQLRKHLVDWKNPDTGIVENKTGVYSYAIDMNNDDNISLTDLVRVRKVLVGIDIDE